MSPSSASSVISAMLHANIAPASANAKKRLTSTQIFCFLDDSRHIALRPRQPPANSRVKATQAPAKTTCTGVSPLTGGIVPCWVCRRRTKQKAKAVIDATVASMQHRAVSHERQLGHFSLRVVLSFGSGMTLSMVTTLVSVVEKVMAVVQPAAGVEPPSSSAVTFRCQLQGLSRLSSS
mmetsp:Transcript_4594/g.7988  ORF Transcript_4594/g.7988 Transcript_4594/m.7988 type:complete len:178 (+) Transcript_4594:1151-1684(+)